MSKVLIVYYSRTGNTAAMAEEVKKGAETEGLEVICKPTGQVKAEELLNYEGIIVGSPTYYGTMAAPVKELFDESVKFHGKLEGKVGGAFASSANIGGGNETTILDILKAMLIHGMVIRGDHRGDHYGPVAIGAPDARSKKLCVALGKRVAALVKQLYPQD